MHMQHIIAGLPNACSQYPSLHFFFGKRAKVSALQALFSNNVITRRRTRLEAIIIIIHGPVGLTIQIGSRSELVQIGSRLEVGPTPNRKQ